MEKQIRVAKIELSKSINSVLEEGEKAKKSGGKKIKPKTELALLTLSPVQTQSILVNLKSSDTNIEELCMSHEKIAEKNIKNIVNMKNILEK